MWSSLTKRSVPRLPYHDIKKTVLGAQYELSLAFVGEKRAQKINKEFRNKNYVPNVLSFPYSKKSGEIVICPAVAEREAKAGGMTVKERILFLYIHGLLHLKGFDHGHKMEKAEQKLLDRFS